MAVGADRGFGGPPTHGGPVDAPKIDLGLLGVTTPASRGDVLTVDGGLRVVGPTDIMAGVAIVAGRGRLPCRHGPAMDTLLVELVGLGHGDLPPLHQGAIGVAAAARLCHLVPARGRAGIPLWKEVMGGAVAVLALRGLFHALAPPPVP